MRNSSEEKWLTLETLLRSIYKVHAENKDKDFELEVSWLCEASGNRFQPVPVDIVAVSTHASCAATKRASLIRLDLSSQDAAQKAKEALDDDMED